MDWLLGPSLGCVTDPNQMRALTQGELEKLALSNYNAMMNCIPREYYSYSMLTQYQPPQPPQPPLDGRFADFKVRLAAAIERRRK